SAAEGADQQAALMSRIRASSPEGFAALEKDLTALPPEVSKELQLAAIRGQPRGRARAPPGARAAPPLRPARAPAPPPAPRRLPGRPRAPAPRPPSRDAVVPVGTPEFPNPGPLAERG